MHWGFDAGRKACGCQDRFSPASARKPRGGRGKFARLLTIWIVGRHCSRGCQVLEEALTTALTDRPYNPVVHYAGVSSHTSARSAGIGAADAQQRGQGSASAVRSYRGGSQHAGITAKAGASASEAAAYGSARSRSGEADVEVWRRAMDNYACHDAEESELAEVDFRQQYDDFA